MYSFKDLHTEEENIVSHSDILLSVSQEYIWAYYIGNFKVNKLTSAPYRTDKNPSFILGYRHDGKLAFKDFGRINMSGDVFDYIMKVYNLSFKEACLKINKDLNLGLLKGSREAIKKTTEVKKLERIAKKVSEEKEKENIQVLVRPYTISDLDYWKQYGITYEILQLYNVYCAKKVFLNKKEVYSHSINSPCYVYHFPKSNNIKCYHPKKKTHRFFPSNFCKEKDIQGYYQCNVKKGSNKDDNKILFLTKSLKDVMVFRKFGYDSMALHGEAHIFPTDFIRHIKKYYKYIVLLYDFDITGIKASRKNWSEYRLPPFFIPKKYRKKGIKDISDLFKEEGEEIVREVIQEILKKVKSLKIYETN